MKAKNKITLVLVGVLLLTLSSFKSITQDTLTIKAVYDGVEDYGYNFIHTNSEGDERTIIFQEIKDDVLASFDLESDELIGENFKVTYTSTTVTETDEDGFDDEVEVLTIIKLEKIK
ncbi:hypothetical protein [Lacinutrix sp. MedPE-SW]|uniref:hypothetical protein n=1 Tax=Lacinutrix sp. MedPE-SW TaxID=1860087 RepID=UPI00091C154F|nr:hypothetical protein [Lacinutrix sp. MedPE-SW]OIQ23180.1 MAG: hypothetical protein BM549_03970 [Lacinutrix sp. MedPE-SW]